MREDGRIQKGHIGAVLCEEGYGIVQAWDDTTGEDLDPDLVRQARDDERAEVEKHKVYLPSKICQNLTKNFWK